jgi:UDP:flavonoid glycosyltransferase YjiC (YdhE family)
MRVVLQAFGSLGDLHPTMAVGLALKARGHEVTLVTHEQYRLKVRRERLGFEPMPPDFGGAGVDVEELYRKTMDGARASEFVMRELCLPHVRGQYDALARAAAGADVIVAHPLGYVAPLAAAKLGIPWVSTALQPLIQWSATDPSVYPNAPWATPLLRLSPVFGRLFVALGRAQTRSWMAPVDALRRDLGLPPADKHPMFEGMVSERLHLCLFSRVLAAPQADWPRSSLQTGFAFYDRGDDGATMPPGLVEFLDAGPPPIVFTLGSSAVMVAGGFYRTAAEVARALGRRAVLLVGRDPRNALEDLPEGRRGVRVRRLLRALPPRGRDRPPGRRGDDGAGAAGRQADAGRPLRPRPARPCRAHHPARAWPPARAQRSHARAHAPPARAAAGRPGDRRARRGRGHPGPVRERRRGGGAGHRGGRALSSSLPRARALGCDQGVLVPPD